MEKELSVKRRKFVEAYINYGNGKQAAIKAGYSPKTAESQASRLLRNRDVRNYQRQLLEKSTTKAIMQKEEVLRKLTIISRSNIVDILEIKENKITLRDFDASKETNNKFYAIKRLFMVDNKIVVDMFDKIPVLCRLLSHYEKIDELNSPNNDDDSLLHQKLIERIKKMST